MARMNAVATGQILKSPDYPAPHPSLTVREIDLWRATQSRIQPVNVETTNMKACGASRSIYEAGLTWITTKRARRF
jgi:hypothetical protein